MGERSYAERMADQVLAVRPRRAATHVERALIGLAAEADDEMAALKAENESLRGRVTTLEAFLGDMHEVAASDREQSLMREPLHWQHGLTILPAPSDREQSLMREPLHWQHGLTILPAPCWAKGVRGDVVGADGRLHARQAVAEAGADGFLAVSARLLRAREVCARTGLARSTLYDLVRRDEFPAPIRLTASTVAWSESEVDDWIRERIERSRAASAC